MVVPGACLDGLRKAVDDRLTSFLVGKMSAAAGLNGDGVLPLAVVEELRDFVLRGGKRLRPLLCLLGWQAANAGPARDVADTAVGVAASLEMFHAFALIHDDVMDDSLHRRGHPTLQHAFARRLALANQDSRASERIVRGGIGAAILAGDLALAWSDELLHGAGLSPTQWAAVTPLVDVMRTELMAGQYLDIAGPERVTGDVERALKVVRYKTAGYTVERPLHIGGALAGAGRAFQEACTAFAVPLGEAFQLQDDLLGVFGDPAVTGKSCLEDVRDARGTVLMALAVRAATAAQVKELHRYAGDPALDEAGMERVRSVLLDTGAAAAVERMIAERLDRARTGLDAAGFPSAVSAVVHRIIDSQAARTA